MGARKAKTPTHPTPTPAPAPEWLDRLTREEIGWRPDVGDMIVGQIVDLQQRSTEYGPCPVVVVKPNDVEAYGDKFVAVWAFHYVLRGELKAARPQVGDMIAVKRLPDGDGYHLFKVAIKGLSGREFDWDAPGVAGESRKEREAARAAALRSPFNDDDDLPF